MWKNSPLFVDFSLIPLLSLRNFNRQGSSETRGMCLKYWFNQFLKTWFFEKQTFIFSVDIGLSSGPISFVL